MRCFVGIVGSRYVSILGFCLVCGGPALSAFWVMLGLIFLRPLLVLGGIILGQFQRPIFATKYAQSLDAWTGSESEEVAMPLLP